MKRTAIVICVGLLTGCSSVPPSQPAGTAAPASIAYTSKSPEAIAHLVKGEEFLDNQRPDEALEEFTAALKLDPGFVLAQADHGVATPGPAGLKEIESAAAASKDLPEGERLIIDAALLTRRGDRGAAIEALRRLTNVAPGYARGYQMLGTFLLGEENPAEGVPALKKAIELNPNSGAAQNMLGYAVLREGDTEGAIAAFKEYVRIMPMEPNAQDSLAEALLAAGRFKESEAVFQKALELSPRFWNAHQGIAMARYYAGDMTGARDAWTKAKATATRPGDKISVDADMAAASLAQNKTSEALQILQEAAKTEGATPAQGPSLAVLRAQTLIVAGRAKDALTPVADALKAVDSGELPPGPTRDIRRLALRARVMAEALLKDVAAAKATSAALDMEAASRTENFAQDAMHFGRGELAAAGGDMAAAKAHFDQCSGADDWCRWYGVMAAEKAGDKAAAAAGRGALLKLYGRDQIDMIIRSRLTTSGS